MVRLIYLILLLFIFFSIRLPAWTRITAKGEGQTPRRRTGWYAKLPTIWEDRSRKEGVILKRRCLESVHVTSHAEENPILRELETILYAEWLVLFVETVFAKLFIRCKNGTKLTNIGIEGNIYNSNYSRCFRKRKLPVHTWQ